MSERITNKTLRTLFAAFVSSAERAGFDTEHWFLEEGSVQQGRGWRHFTHKYRDGSVGSGNSLTEFRDFLGSTPRQAYETLSTRIDTLSALALLKEQSSSE